MTIPFLPATLDQSVRGPKKAGTWEHYAELLDKLPDDLRIEGSVTAESLTAIPTVWARPLLFAEALFSGDAHPLNKEVVGEWRGLLGIFCFRGYYRFQLSTRSYDVSGPSSERFARVLNTLRPDSEWQTIHLVYLDNVVLGASSPKSLFFAAADYGAEIALNAIPWRNEQSGRLSDPAEYFTANGMEHELGVLRDWIEDGINELGRSSSPADDLNKATTNELLRLLGEWRDSIPIREGHERALFHEPLIGVPPYQFASKKALVVEKVQSDFLLATTKIGGIPPIVIWEEGWKHHKEKAVFGVFRPGDVSIPQEPQGTTLARGKIRYPWIRPDFCFFTDKLLKIPLAQDRILSSHELGYLPPLKKEILKYFSPSDLEDALEWKKQDDGVQVTLKLPLKTSDGPSPAGPALISRYYKDNEIEEPWAGAGTNPPFLALWPDFEILTIAGMPSRPWRHYYCLCENRGANSLFAVLPVNSSSPFETREYSLLWRLSEYPEALECFIRNEPAGLMLLRPPRTIPDGNGTWTVAVDFGTSNTTIFFSDGGEPSPLLLQNHWVQLTSANLVALRFFLFTEFLPLLLPNDGPILGIFPSHFQSFRPGAPTPEPFVDGIILFDEPVKWSDALARKNVEQNLKWATDPNKRRFIYTFLKQVLLMIAAEARNQNVANLKVRWSYPSAFANDMLTDFESVWESLTRPGNEMGVDVSLEFSETESVAVCKYMTLERKAKVAAHTRAQIIIDVGGGTSDIAIWLAGELKAQSSIVIAGNILSRYAQKQVAFASSLARITGVSQLEELIQNPSRSAAALNLVLKRSGDTIQTNLAAGENIRPEFKRARTIILFAFSAIAYYVGLILKFIHQDSPIDSCDVYLAGNGAKLLTWVSSDSGIKEALTVMLRANLTLSEITNNFPNVNKQEVARGLLYNRPLPHAKNVILQIVGEDGYEFDGSGRSIPWSFNLYEQMASLNDNVVHVPSSFTQLTNFLQAFDTEAAKLGLEQVAVQIQAGAIQAGVEQAISDMVRENKDDKASIQSFFIQEVNLVLNELIDGQI